MADNEEKPEEDVNIWQDLLANSTSAGWNTASTATSTLVVLGDRVNGKSSVLNKFRDRVTDAKNNSEYILDFSYINVKNRYNLDQDETVSRMSVWQLDDGNHSDLLTKLIPAKDLDNCCYVITLDLSKPWNVLNSLNAWLKVVEDVNEKIITQLSAEEQTALKTKISKYIQTYVDPGTEKKIADAVEEAKEEEKKAGEEGEAKAEPTEAPPAEDAAGDGEIAVDPAVPAKNLGVPLVIVGTKADYFNRVLKSGADEKFEFVAQRLRKAALEWGATTIFTSAFGEGANIDVLQDHIFTRVLGMPNKSSAKVVGSSEDFTIFSPAGFDSLELINSASTSKSGWGDDTKFEEVFENTDKKKKGEEKGDMIVAMGNDEFFKALRAQLEKGVPFDKAPSATTGSGKDEQKKYVKSFFKNLLNSEKKES